MSTKKSSSSKGTDIAATTAQVPAWRRAVKRGVRMILAVGFGFAAFIVLFLLLYQRKMMYFPSSYERIELNSLPEGGVLLAYETSQGKQTAFYLPPSDAPAKPPETLWVLFNGNAARALDWLDVIEKVKTPHAAFLLVDYPGYGACEGKPSRAAIRESTEKAYEALAKHLGVDTATLDTRVNVLAFSIGTGAGMDFAAARPVRRVILLAPFTSALDMARRTVGWPLCYLLIDRFDNRARLAELAARSDPPRVDIYHGRNDDIIPFAMSGDLAAQFPNLVTFHPVPGADHNFLLMAVESQLVTQLAEPPE